MTTISFADYLGTNPFLILSGALGTELQRRGYKTKLPLWSAQANVDAHGLVMQIHKDYFDAGADLAITNTFRTTPRTYRKVGDENAARDALRNAVSAAMNAKDTVKNRPAFVGGSFAPLEDCYRPDLVPSQAELEHEHGLMAEWLAAEKVDFMFPETINALPEAVAMARAASSTGLPFIISFVTDEDARLLDGTPLDELLDATNLPSRAGIALNCRPIDIIDNSFKKLSALYDGLIGVYPNGFGQPHDDLGWLFETNSDSMDRFVKIALAWKDAGARMIGGCCGTTPDYIRALATACGRVKQAA